jgi:predicted alternative tryptophan synthase beta-subunit
VKDRSQYGNHGTGINAPTWTGNGKWGGAYEFSGNYIKLANTVSALNTSYNSLCTWINAYEYKLYDTFFAQAYP